MCDAYMCVIYLCGVCVCLCLKKCENFTFNLADFRPCLLPPSTTLAAMPTSLVPNCELLESVLWTKCSRSCFCSFG